MRRKDREVADFDGITDILKRCDVVRLGLNGDPYPYVVPLSFGYQAGNGRITIYFHGANVGHKHDLIEKNDNVCVEADIFRGYVHHPGGGGTVDYESFIGFGKITRITGGEAVRGMELILEHCGYGGMEFELNDKTRMYKIELESFSGKKRFV
jgi:nitroimidazol reductase NimA-like FMN-containing flavoprotein (pyridoxamine 5'-phosphate oxidase superfamily)